MVSAAESYEYFLFLLLLYFFNGAYVNSRSEFNPHNKKKVGNKKWENMLPFAFFTRMSYKMFWIPSPSRPLQEVPVLVAYSPKHQRSARFVGAWDEESLGLFLGKSLGGREAMFPIGGNEGPRCPNISPDFAKGKERSYFTQYY